MSESGNSDADETLKRLVYSLQDAQVILQARVERIEKAIDDMPERIKAALTGSQPETEQGEKIEWASNAVRSAHNSKNIQSIMNAGDFITRIQIGKNSWILLKQSLADGTAQAWTEVTGEDRIPMSDAEVEQLLPLAEFTIIKQPPMGGDANPNFDRIAMNEDQ